MDWPVTYRRKIRFSETDAQGIVFNGNYATYIGDTITDYFDAIGLPWKAFTRSGHDMVLARTETDFRSAGRLGETLVTGARVTRIGKTSVVFVSRTWEETSARVVIEARLIQVVVDHSTLEPKPVHDFFIEAVQRAQGEAVERS
jgi:YbgC/YbaW family acyl-CoA thioester hydrolase